MVTLLKTETYLDSFEEDTKKQEVTGVLVAKQGVFPLP